MKIAAWLTTYLAGLLAPHFSTPEPKPSSIPTARAGVKVGASAIAASRLPTNGDTVPQADWARRLFAPAKPLPGVVPDDVTPMAMDDACSIYAGQAYTGNIQYSGVHWLGFPFLAELAQRAEYRRISETIAREMTRRWFKLVAIGEDDKTDKIRALEEHIRRHRLQTKLRRIAELDGYFGRAHLYIDTGYSEDREQLKIPLAVDNRIIRKGDLKSLRVIEPVWTYPMNYNSIDPLLPDWYAPTTWFVMAKEIHRSRLLTFVGREVPDLFKPAYSFSGLSMTQIAMDYVNNWLRTRQSVSDLVHSFNTPVLSSNLATILNNGGGEDERARAALFNNFRDNNNLMMIDKETEDFRQVSASLGTLDHLQAQSQEHMASVAGIPLVVLTGITPSGLNASSDGELQVWAQTIHAAQTSFFDENLKTILNILQLDLFGEIDPDITHSWEPLEELSPEELAQTKKTEADTDAVYVNAGVLSPDEIRTRLAGEVDSPYQGIDLDQPAPQPPEQPGAGPPEGESDPAAEEPQPTEAQAQGRVPPAGGHSRPVASPPVHSPRAGGNPSGLNPRGSRDQGEAHEHTRIIPDDDDLVHVHVGPQDQVHVKLGRIGGGLDEFKEEEHPREEHGKFTSGGGSSGSGGEAEAETRQPMVAAERDASGKLTNLPPHIASLKIPPAWTDVTYNADPNAALMVKGKDVKGRPQSIYSDAHHMAQAASKFARIHELNSKFDSIQQQNNEALKSTDPRTRASAEVAALIMHTGIRPGSEEDTGAKEQAYGATTLQGKHVVANPDGTVNLQFTGKKGVKLNIPVTDPAIAGRLKARQQKAGPDGQLFPEVNEGTLLSHVHSFDGGGFKTKDFRTLVGTRTAMAEVAKVKPPTNEKEYKRAVHEVAKRVSAKLGNTPTVALQSYISPTVFSGWQNA